MGVEACVLETENIGKYRLISWVCPSTGWFDDNGKEVSPVAAIFKMIDDKGLHTNITLDLNGIKNSKLPFVENHKKIAIDRLEKEITLSTNLIEVT